MPSSAPRKGYALNQSPLFRLRGKGRFEDIIGVKWESVPDLLSADCFQVWKGLKDREIQAPIHWMAAVHKVIYGPISVSIGPLPCTPRTDSLRTAPTQPTPRSCRHSAGPAAGSSRSPGLEAAAIPGVALSKPRAAPPLRQSRNTSRV